MKSKVSVAIINGKLIKRDSLNELVEYIQTTYEFKNVKNWTTKDGIPKKYENIVKFIGTIEEE
ncbi:MAG: hypothetical protein ACRC7N_19415 [Clostridium sp.]